MSKSTNDHLPDDFEDLDFEIVEEHWNEYELEDGNRIKGRVFLRKIIRDPNNPNSLNINTSKPEYVVYSTSSNRGERNNEPRPNEYETLPKHEVRIKNNNEKFNIYRILRNGQQVRLRLSVVQVLRIKDRFDKDGLPFYVINSSPMFVADPQPNNQGQ